jgi:hypothetical protein
MLRRKKHATKCAAKNMRKAYPLVTKAAAKSPKESCTTFNDHVHENAHQYGNALSRVGRTSCAAGDSKFALVNLMASSNCKSRHATKAR